MMNIFSQINFSKFLDKSYVFETKPDSSGLYKYLLIVFVAFIIGAIVLIIKQRKMEKIYHKLYAKIISLFMFTSIAGFAYMFFRWQEIPYISSRITLIALLLTFIIWLALILLYKYLTLPKEIKEYKQNKIFEKYLP